MKRIFKCILIFLVVFNFMLVPNINASALGDKLKFENFSIVAHANGEAKFKSGVFDGSNIWLVPYNSDNLVKFNTNTGEITSFNITNYVLGDAKFSAGVFDGSNIWLIPYNSDKLLKVNASTNEITAYILENPTDNFSAGVFDGVSLWLIPYTSDDIIKVNVSTGEMLPFKDTRLYTDTVGKTTPQFVSASYDGTNIWLIPANTSKLLKIEPNNSDNIVAVDISAYNTSNSTRFDMNSSSLFVNSNLWIIPNLDNKIIKYNVNDTTKNAIVDTSSYLNLVDDGIGNMSGNVFTSSIYDGTNIWLNLNNNTSNENALVKLNPNDNSTSKFSILTETRNNDYYGSVFDGNNMWLIPYNSDNLLKISTDHTVDTVYEVVKKFRTVTNKQISDDVIEKVEQGGTYTTSKNKITGYTLIGYTLNDGPLETGDIKIENIKSNHKVTLIYGQNEVLPQTGLNSTRLYIIGSLLLIVGIFGYVKFIYLKDKKNY